MGAWFVNAVWPNLFASLLWAPIAFGASHLLLRRHITNTAAQQTAVETLQATKEDATP